MCEQFTKATHEVVDFHPLRIDIQPETAAMANLGKHDTAN
jgi:hypothetical protein